MILFLYAFYLNNLLLLQQELTYLNLIFIFKHHSMEQSQDLLKIQNSQPVINRHNLLCQGKQPADFVCYSVGCTERAFRCGNNECICNNGKHNNCSNKMESIQFILRIQKSKQEASSQIREIFQHIIEKYDEMVQKVSLDRLQFIEYSHNFGLTEAMLQTIRLINEQEYQNINGQFIQSMFSKKHSSIYSPNKMSHYEEIREAQIQIQYLLNKLSYNLTDQWGKIDKVIQKFGRGKTNFQNQHLQNKHWDFIPIQIKFYVKLNDLDLCGNSIRRLKNLENCSQLKELWLQYNHIQKIENLDHMIDLKKLYLRYNNIKKIQNLDSLINLQYLSLNNNNIQKIQNLDKLVKLQWLSMNSNQITIVENLENLAELSTLWLLENPLIITEQAKQMLQKFRQKKLKKLSLPPDWPIF